MTTVKKGDTMDEDIVRVIRILEYVGPRKHVEETLERSIKGTDTHKNLTIRAATLGDFPEIMEKGEEDGREESTESSKERGRSEVQSS